MPYAIQRLVADDGALVDRTSHHDVNFISGRRFPPDFPAPVTFDIDTDEEGRRLPTLFTVPVFLARREFLALLNDAGVDNVDAYPAVIRDPDTGRLIRDYLALNVVGLVASADLAASEYAELGPGLLAIDRVVLDPKRTPDALMYRLAEDPLQIIVADSIAERVRAAGFDDVYLNPLTVGG
jgi:hypothetical protein